MEVAYEVWVHLLLIQRSEPATLKPISIIKSLNKHSCIHYIDSYIICNVPDASLSTLGRNHFLVIGRGGLSSHRLSPINTCKLLQRKANTWNNLILHKKWLSFWIIHGQCNPQTNELSEYQSSFEPGGVA